MTVVLLAGRPRVRIAALRWLLWLGLLVCSGIVCAQTLEDTDVWVQDDSIVLRVRFNASVRLLQLVPTGVGEAFNLRFEMLAADDAVLRQGSEEFRRLPPGQGLPEVALRYLPEPGNRVKQMTIRLSAGQSLQARQGPNSRSIDLLFARPRAAPPVAPVPAAAASATLSEAPPETPGEVRLEHRFGLVLQSVPAAQRDTLPAPPVEFKELHVFRNEVAVDGRPEVQLVVGFFADASQAEAARTIARARFPDARVLDLGATVDANPIDSLVAQATVGPPEIELEAVPLLDQARAALAAGRADDAVVLLGKLLKLPPNSASIAAQELIGQAWEQDGDPRRARIEDALYLKLYPQGEGAGRVGARLAALGGPLPASVGSGATETAVARKPWNGSVAQYYYGGKARSRSLVNIATGIDQSTLSHTTESAIVTSVDMSGRMASEHGETRAVIRGSGSSNLLPGGQSESSIGSAYLEYRRENSGLAVRAGRQSPISGGLLGLFDGVSLATPVGAGLRLDVMGGVPAGALVSAPAERLFAAVLEADAITERVSGNLYLLQQSTQGITNRRALGSELRYAGDQWSTDALLDYDVDFKLLNAVSFNGSFRLAGQTTVTLLADERRAPSLQLTNALISSGAASLKDLLQTRTAAQIRADALATSAIAKQWLISVARPLNPHWQVSSDLRYSEIGALPAVGDFEATPATGGQTSVSAQLTGTDLYSSHDLDNVSLSVIHTPFFRGVQFSYNNLTELPGQREITIEPSLRLYSQHDNQGVKLTRLGPGARVSWRFSSRASLLGEMLYEAARTDGPTNHDRTNSVFFYVGYRYEVF